MECPWNSYLDEDNQCVIDNCETVDLVDGTSAICLECEEGYGVTEFVQGKNLLGYGPNELFGGQCISCEDLSDNCTTCAT